MRVTDDGVGVGTPVRHSGLRSMAERALQLAGRFDITTRPAGGTELVWQVPLHPAAR